MVFSLHGCSLKSEAGAVPRKTEERKRASPIGKPREPPCKPARCSAELKYDYRDPTGWGATQPAYEAQMKQLQAWLDEAKANGTKKVLSRFTLLRSAAPVWAPFPKRNKG